MKLEKFTQEYIDPVSRIWNRKAFDQIDSGDHTLAIVRLDSLGLIRRMLGKGAGDAALLGVGSALDHHFPSNAFRLTDHEFLAIGISRIELLSGVLIAQEEAMRLTVNRDRYRYKIAARLSFGIANNLEDAYRMLNDGDRSSYPELEQVADKFMKSIT